MKVVSTEALTKLIQLVKSAFVKVEDVVETSEVTLADVALSGDYNDLSNKPTIPSEVTESTVSGWGFTKNTGTVTSVNNVSPVNGNVTLSIPAAQVNSDWNATSGVARILNKPTIPTVPTNVSAFTNDSGYITSSALTGYATQTWVGQQGYITGITSSDVTTALGYTPYNASNPSGYITNSALDPYALSADLASVATSGSYNDLLNKPDLSTKADVDLSNINTNGKSFVSGLGMPSSRYIDLTLGASGTSYTAPANGWCCIKKASDGSNQFLSLQTPKIQLDSDANSSGNYVGLTMPVSKGDVFTIYYNLGGSTAVFRFIYAEGENV